MELLVQNEIMLFMGCRQWIPDVDVFHFSNSHEFEKLWGVDFYLFVSMSWRNVMHCFGSCGYAMLRRYGVLSSGL